MGDTGIGLAKAIGALREELLQAISDGEGSPMQFRLAPLELSLQVVVTREADGKLGWQVLEFGGSHVKAVTQTLTVRLEPTLLAKDGIPVADFMIADQSSLGGRVGPRS